MQDSSYQMSQVLHWLLCGSLTTQLKPHLALEKHDKTARARCPRTPAGACTPPTLRAQVLKK